MRGRLLSASCGLLLGSGIASAQFPSIPQAPTYPGPQAPLAPQAPNPLPPLFPVAPIAPGTMTAEIRPPGSPQHPIAQAQEIPLPHPENKFAIKASEVSLRRIQGGWQLWAGQRLLRDFGNNEMDARDAFRVYRDLRPTEWVTIGSPKPVVEYALVNGRPAITLGMPGADEAKTPMAGGNYATETNRPAVTAAGAKTVIPIDMRTVRVEPVRGIWCLRDDNNIHLNFGLVKADADQALAVVRRYGFNRIGVVGSPNPIMTYFFVGQDGGQQAAPGGPFAQAVLQQQIDGLSRVGIPVPGVGFVGEMIPFDPKKLVVRKDGYEWVVVAGSEVLGRYGPTEWAARDAARTIADGHFTEFCKLGSAGLTFFLANGKAPNHLPLSVQGRRFDNNALKVRQVNGKWAVTENGRYLFDCASAEEGETIVRVVKYFGFDQLCHLGPTPKLGLSFLAKGQ